MTEPQRRILTAEHLYDLPLEDVRAELVRGDLICEPPAGIEHGIRTSKVGHHLERYIEEHPVGVVCGAETGFVLFRNPDTVRAPDAAFISRERFERFVEKEKYFEGAPDLAAEVVSPGDSRREETAEIVETLLWIVIFLFVVSGWLGSWRERRTRQVAQRALAYSEDPESRAW